MTLGATSSPVQAFEVEVEEKRRLNAKLERELDMALAEATQAEAERRLAYRREEEARSLAAAAAKMAEDRAAAQAASKIASEQASLDRAVRSAAAAVNATADAIRTAGAPTAALIAAEATKKDEIFVTLKDRRAARDAAVAEVEAEAAAKIELANRQVAEIEANVKGDADAVALSYGFAALAGGLLVGNELGLGLAPAGLVGAGLGVGAMFLWGVQKAEPVPSTASATAEE